MINVLIVDDDPMVSALNKRYVESVEGFRVKGLATTGEEALEYLKTKDIDLVILDVYMPRMDGLALLKEMRAVSIFTDVILVTAAKETDQINLALKLGAIDYLIKPFEFERLKESLENYLNRYNLLQQKNGIGQKDIDKITMGDHSLKNSRPQKGLHSKTLGRIKKFMKERQEQYISSDEIGEALGLSKVTIRKYLGYLESVGEVKLEIEYGSVGRPRYLYKFIE